MGAFFDTTLTRIAKEGTDLWNKMAPAVDKIFQGIDFVEVFRIPSGSSTSTAQMIGSMVRGLMAYLQVFSTLSVYLVQKEFKKYLFQLAVVTRGISIQWA